MEQTYNAEKIYEELLTSTEMLEYVQNQCGMAQEVGELITVGTASGFTSDRLLPEERTVPSIMGLSEILSGQTGMAGLSGWRFSDPVLLFPSIVYLNSFISITLWFSC